MLQVFDARIKKNFGMVVTGPPHSGKTTFVSELLKNSERLLEVVPKYVVWFYGEKSQTVREIEQLGTASKIRLVRGLPDNLEDFIEPAVEHGGLFVFDDLMSEASNSSEIARLATNKTQHAGISYILLMQNFFHQGKARITLQRSCHYLVLFKNPLDQSAARHLAHQLSPQNPKAFVQIYEAATREPHGYLFIDGHQTTPDFARFRTDIFGHGQRVFRPLVPPTKRKL